MKILDGKLLMMTPVDPAFLLARILKATMPVSLLNCGPKFTFLMGGPC